MTTFRSFVCEQVGKASMCWSDRPKGIFDSEQAVKIVNEITAEYEKVVKINAELYEKYILALGDEVSIEKPDIRRAK